MENEMLVKISMIILILIGAVAFFINPLFQKTNLDKGDTTNHTSTLQNISQTSFSEESIKIRFVRVPKYFATNIIKTYDEIKGYKKEDTYYYVMLLSGNGYPTINHQLKLEETTQCIIFEIDYKPTTRTITDYDIMIVIKAPYSCLKYKNNNTQEKTYPQIMNKECVRDEECIHQPAYCHPKSQPCVPYYTLTNLETLPLLEIRKDIACTMECRPCIECKCIEGKCESIKSDEGCC